MDSLGDAIDRHAKAPSASAAPKLRISGLAKRFGRGAGADLVVFEDLTFSVGDLEFLALIGPSGCGKSTVLRIIDGLEPPDGGTIAVDGREVRGPGPERAMVFQSFDLFPWRTAIENIAFGLEVRGVPRRKQRERARRCIELVGLA